MKNIREINYNGFRWIDVVDFDQKTGAYLKKNYGFQEANLEDCLSPTQRPKVEKYPGYNFLILLFPIYNRQTRQITPTEIDFFIGKKYLITVHRNESPPIIDTFNICRSNQEKKQEYLKRGSVYLLHHLLNQLYGHCFPMLDHISLGISRVKKSIFSGHERKMVQEILFIRQNIADFRKIMQVHKNTLQKLAGKNGGCENIISTKHQATFNNLVNLAKEIWDNLESFREAIENLQETNESLISNKLNDIMKLLTVISTILLPITLIASVFGMNSQNMPIIGQPYDFWVIIGLGAAVVIFMVLYFKKRRWI